MTIGNKSFEVLTNQFVASGYPVVRQVEQQYEIEGQIRLVERDLKKIEHYTKDGIEIFNRLQSRIVNIKNKSYASDNNSCSLLEIENDIANATSPQLILGSSFMKCPACGLNFLRSSFGDHTLVCSQKLIEITKSDENAIVSNGKGCCMTTNQSRSMLLPVATKPQAPLNLHAINISCDSIDISWDSPILDGGKPLTEYEILFDKSKIKRNLIQKDVNSEERESSLCSRRCFSTLLTQNIFTCSGLMASSEYSIKLRCRNIIGWSDFSKILDGVITLRKI